MTTHRALLFALAIAWCAATDAAEPSAPGGVEQDADRAASALDAIRGHIVALEIEEALAAVETFLARPSLTDSARADALDLRSQAHAASDDLDAAEEDYHAILELRPDYVPNPGLTSKKAMERFGRVAAATIGTLHLDIDPPDAMVFIDGRPVTRTPGGAIKALAGERRLKAERKGYDPAELPVHAVAGQQTLLRIALVPNARSIVVRTDLAGVSVALDGTPAGVTALPEGALTGAAAAELLIEDVPIGEHAIRLEKSCYAAESLAAMIRVDMADRSPDPLRLVTMRPARARVGASGASYPGELRVDGEVVASLPLAEFTVCPGRRVVEVVASGRVVWSGVLLLEEADSNVDLSPRPNCGLVGSEWPKAWTDAASAWSLRGRLDPPAGDLSTPAGWASLTFPPGTDLAVGVLPRAGVAGEDRVVMYSPALGVVEDRPVPPVAGRPTWIVASAGATFVDGPAGVLVATVVAGGPAGRVGLAPGDAVVSSAGRKVARAADLRSEIEAVTPGSKIGLEVVSPSREKRTVAIETVGRAHTVEVLAEGDSRIVRAAWGAADAAAGGAAAPAALANLALLFERAGREDAAIEAWRKVRALAGAQAELAARADYALGTSRRSERTAAEAAALLERAKSEAEAAGDALLAAASADRLADLGISPR